MNNLLAKRNFDLVSLDGLDSDKQKEIVNIKNNLTLQYDNVVDYGSSASKNLSNFSTELLSSIKVKDSPEVEGMLTELMSGLEEVDCESLLKKKPNFLKKLLRIDDMKNFMIRYEDVHTAITAVKKKLEQTSFQLKKDVELCDRYMQQNLTYIEELDSYIMAGLLKVQECRDELSAEEATLDHTDNLAVHRFSAKQNDVERLDKKVQDLLLMREIAVQNIPQIQLIKSGDAVLIEKIQSSINSAIPLWESQIVIAVELMRQRAAIDVQRQITDTTNKLITRNSELLKAGAVDVAKELERGIIDIETLKKSQENLIQTLDSIRTISQDGRQQRLQVREELKQIRGKLTDALLLESGNN